ncbi:hypothetical protein [Actinoplanes sp. NPDC020271]|uniref:hypothetical protein n=1 Tax=Actinoplanes sp. NPDC020271 TaxID=3363896 RepID=UPI0037B5A793
MVEVEVRTRVTGTSGGLPSVLVQLAEERVTARELIRRTVEEQIRVVGADATRCRPMLDRQFLSDHDVRAQAATGVVRLPRRSPPEAPHVATEVTRAQQAFARGSFLIFAGGRQVTTLDEELTIRLGEPVTFLRLVPLAGG